jgi:hypothetical protein
MNMRPRKNERNANEKTRNEIREVSRKEIGGSLTQEEMKMPKNAIGEVWRSESCKERNRESLGK